MTKNAALEGIIAKLNKKYGPNTLVRGSDIEIGPPPRITSGSLSLDVALGGGWAANQWNEVIGVESSGKTALVLKTIAANQAVDPNWHVLWCASEDFVETYAVMLGCDLDRFSFVYDNTMEVVYQACIDAISQRAVDCVVIDSLPALVPLREEENTMLELQPGLGAFLTGKFFRMSNSVRKGSVTDPDAKPVTGLVVNQWREKIGVQYGDPRTTPGGVGKNFFFFVRVEVRRDDWITNSKDQRVGQTLKIRNLKNKTAPPGEVGVVDYYFAPTKGFAAGSYDTMKEYIAVGIAMDVITRQGAWYHFAGDKWNGKEDLTASLREDLDLQTLLREEVMRKVTKPDIEEDSEPSKKAKKTAPKSTAKVRKIAKK